MPLVARYPHAPLTAEPTRLTAQQIWSVAQGVRTQMTADAWLRRLDVDAIVGATESMCVNDLTFGAIWDLDHTVSNEAGQPMMGLAHFDRAEPDSIYVSINGVALAGRDEMLRSTVAHELGHVVFDGPGWIKGASPDRAATSGEVEGPKAPPRRNAPAPDWREFRANEFMGALLAPLALLRLDLQRFAKRHRFRPSPAPSRITRGSPAYDGPSLEEDAVADLLFTLAENYGLSESFIRVRLDRYDLLRSRSLSAAPL